ncbi:MAG: hypothetical protein JJE03_04370 [Peptostreptococcaceae bacterium]|nr:hypothetical protein [Peptostreptococcaceae bacterium]
MSNKTNESTSGMAKLIFGMGLGSLLAIPIFAAFGFLIEDYGMMQPFTNLVIPVALIAIILRFIFKKKIGENSRSKKLANTGLLLGIISISLIVILILGVMIVFLPDFFIN